MNKTTAYLIRLALFVALLAGFHDVALSQSFDARVVHVYEGGPAVDVHFVNMEQPTITDLLYEFASPTVSNLPIGTGTFNVKVTPANAGLAGAIIDQNVTVAGSTEYTAVIYQADLQPRLKVLERPKSKLPGQGKAILRVVNLTGGSVPAAFDVYLDSIGDTPRFAGISREQATAFADVTGEPKTIYITASGSKSPLIQFIAPLTAGGRLTLIVAGESTPNLRVHALSGENVNGHRLPILQGIEGGMLSSVRVVHAWWHRTSAGKQQALDIFLDDFSLPRTTNLQYRTASEKYGPLTGDTAVVKFAPVNEGSSSAIYTQRIALQRDTDYVVILTKTSQGAAAALLLGAPNSVSLSLTDSFYIRAAYMTDFHPNITIKAIANNDADTVTFPALSFLTASDWYSILRGPFRIEAYYPGDTTPFYTKPDIGALSPTYLTVIVLGSDSTFEIDILNEILPVRQVFDPAASAPSPIVANAMQLGSFPNPSSGITSLSFTLPAADHVSITLHDNLGRTVATLLDERREAGEQSVRVDAGALPAGLYLYKVRTGGGEYGVGSMVVVR